MIQTQTNKKPISSHLIQVRLTDIQHKKFLQIAKKEGYQYGATLAKQLILNYMMDFNKK